MMDSGWMVDGWIGGIWKMHGLLLLCTRYSQTSVSNTVPATGTEALIDGCSVCTRAKTLHYVPLTNLTQRSCEGPRNSLHSAAKVPGCEEMDSRAQGHRVGGRTKVPWT